MGNGVAVHTIRALFSPATVYSHFKTFEVHAPTNTTTASIRVLQARPQIYAGSLNLPGKGQEDLKASSALSACGHGTVVAA